MFARISHCVKLYNYRLWSPVAFGKFMSTVKPQDQVNIKINEDKEKVTSDYVISQDAQVNIKDLDGKNIRPLDVNPWNQDSNVAEQKNEQPQATPQTQAPAAKV